MLLITEGYTHCVTKSKSLMFDNNFGKCGPIFAAPCYAPRPMSCRRAVSICHVRLLCWNE